MRIGFVTDEISADVKEAITIGTGWGILDYELRVIGKNRVPHISEADVKLLLELKQQHGLRYTAVSPGTFKGTLHDSDLLQRELREVLPASFALAKKLGAGMVIVFGFQRDEADRPGDEARVVEIFRDVAAQAAQQGLVVTVENEPGFWCDTGVNVARILGKVNSPAFRVNWDPANAIGNAERPYPEGYESVKPWIANVHIKDTIKGALIECVPVGEGQVDWEGQIQALVRDRVVGHVTIETHCLPLVQQSQRNLRTVKELLRAARV